MPIAVAEIAVVLWCKSGSMADDEHELPVTFVLNCLSVRDYMTA